MAPVDSGRPVHVHITGFGPFGQYETNPSWQAAQALDNELLSQEPAWPLQSTAHTAPRDSKDMNSNPLSSTRHVEPRSSSSIGSSPRIIRFTASEIPVTYSAAPRLVKAIHNGHLSDSVNDASPKDTQVLASKPDLVVHVGVGLPRALKLETQAQRWGYDKPGSDGQLAPVDDNVADHDSKPRRGLIGREWDAAPSRLDSRIKTRHVVEQLRQRGLKIDESTDAGMSQLNCAGA